MAPWLWRSAKQPAKPLSSAGHPMQARKKDQTASRGPFQSYYQQGTPGRKKKKETSSDSRAIDEQTRVVASKQRSPLRGPLHHGV